MDLNLFIAKRMGSGDRAGKKKLSGTSNKIAAASVAVSILVMILSIAISNGFRHEIVEKITGFSGDFMISAPGLDIVNEQYPVQSRPEMAREIASLPFVKDIRPVSYRSGVIKAGDQIQGVIFKGVDSAYNFDFFSRHLFQGKIPSYGTSISNDILISKRLAELLHYGAGDKVIAYFIDRDGEVRVRRFDIAGIYDAQMEEIDKVLVVADSRHIARLNGWKNGEISGYEILLNRYREKELEEQKEKIEDILYESTAEDDEDSLAAVSLKDKYYVLFDWLHLLDMNVLIILVLMTAVAGFNMVSGLLILLFERISQIGILKALGMRNRDIAGIFLYKAAFIVLKGLLAGNILAGVFCFLEWKYRFIALNPVNYFVKYVPIDISLWTVLWINGAAFIVIMLIMLVPCHFISRISPARSMVVK